MTTFSRCRCWICSFTEATPLTEGHARFQPFPFNVCRKLRGPVIEVVVLERHRCYGIGTGDGGSAAKTTGFLVGYPFGVNHKIHTGSVLQRIKQLARWERQIAPDPNSSVRVTSNPSRLCAYSVCTGLPIVFAGPSAHIREFSLDCTEEN